MTDDLKRKLIKMIRGKIKKNCKDYGLYVKLSWCYLRSGEYEDGISYFNNILPIRHHEKFYAIKSTSSSSKSNKCPKMRNNKDKDEENETEIKNVKPDDDDYHDYDDDDDDSDLDAYLKKKKKKYKT